MKIVFIIKALGNPGGGAERVLTQVVSELASRGHELHVVTCDEVGTIPYYDLGEAITFHPLGIGSVAGRSNPLEFVRRVFGFRRAIGSLQPDVVVAFMHSTYIAVGFSMMGFPIPLIASEHSTRAHYRKHPVQRWLLNLVPWFCERITVVSDQIRESYWKRLQRHMVVISNPVSLAEGGEVNNPKSPGKKILLCVGRLDSPKGHTVLVSAFGLIAKDFPGWTLRIVGEGPLRGALEAQVTALGLKDLVELPGAQLDMSSEFRSAELFVLPSFYESFGLATAEALLHGLPAIGFADCPGTNQLIRDHENGRLVFGKNRIAALAGVLSEVMQNPDERQRLSSSSRRWILDRYGIKHVGDQWEVVLTAASCRNERDC